MLFRSILFMTTIGLSSAAAVLQSDVLRRPHVKSKAGSHHPKADEDEDLCASMNLSAILRQFYAPTKFALQSICKQYCQEVSDKTGTYTADTSCNWGDYTKVFVSHDYVINQKKCEQTCPPKDFWEGDCVCSLGLTDVWVADSEGIAESCTDQKIMAAGYSGAWTNRLYSEGASAPCPGE